MHTRTVDHQLATETMRRTPPPPVPVLTPADLLARHPGQATRAKAQTAAQTENWTAQEPRKLADLDSMLADEPSLGAFRGLRVALLFNAGLAFTGLLAFEVWTLLAR